jgi:soluble lytic murein transglycosylase-like protein
MIGPAAARSCSFDHPCFGKKSTQHMVHRKATNAPHYVWDKRTRKWVASYSRRQQTHGVASVRAAQGRRFSNLAHASKVLPAARQRVVALITSMAPSYGVPTWFALRIAKVESGYNQFARGRAGELGVFQMKCATARGIGFRGSCRGLLDAATNVRYGLKHLSLAVRSSRGNLRLAASKHNGGLGRKRLVHSYVRLVF